MYGITNFVSVLLSWLGNGFRDVRQLWSGGVVGLNGKDDDDVIVHIVGSFSNPKLYFGGLIIPPGTTGGRNLQDNGSQA